jgi:CMP-N,N'-diacetyllegionaminic acid synthase
MIKKNSFWAFVPARSLSKSIKNKNIVLLNKKPLLFYTMNVAKQLLKSHRVEKVIFSSDSNKYFNIAKKYCDIEFHKRINKRLFSDLSTDLDVFKDYVQFCIKKRKYLPEFFIHLRPTTPIRKKEKINKAIEMFYKSKSSFSSLRSVTLMQNPSYKTFRIKNNKLCSLFKNRYNLDSFNLPRQMYPKTYMPNGYIDIIKTKNIINNNFHGNKVLPYIFDEEIVDIDSHSDLKKIKNKKLNRIIK